MAFKTYLSKNPPPQVAAKHQKKFKMGLKKDGRVAYAAYQNMWHKQTERKWWTKTLDISTLEGMIRDNTSRQWKKNQEMSRDALPLLRNKKMDEQLKLFGVASHLANFPELTQACQDRRLNKNYDIKIAMAESGLRCGASTTQLTYAISHGTVPNAKDRDSIYHVEYDQQYSAFNCVSDGDAALSLKDVPGLNFNYVYEPKYTSLLPSFRSKVEEIISRKYIKDSASYKSIMNLINNLDKEDLEDVKFEEPDISHAHTSDYTIYTCSTLCKKNVLTGNVMIKIRRRMVIASMNFAEPPVNIPLVEEIFIETLTKDPNAVFDNADAPFKTDRESFVINFNLISDKYKDATSGPLSDCNSSTIHFFGKNAFSMLIPTFYPTSKSAFDTGHEAGMYVLGWLSRQLDAAALGTSDQNMFKEFLKTSESVADLKNTFVGQQNAGSFFKTEKKKCFYTKTWLSSPTMVVIAITPLSDTSRNMVMVWSAGRNVSADAVASIMKDVKLPVRPGVSRLGELPPLTRRNGEPLVAGSEFTGPRFPKPTSTLPLDLELELQSL